MYLKIEENQLETEEKMKKMQQVDVEKKKEEKLTQEKSVQAEKNKYVKNKKRHFAHKNGRMSLYMDCYFKRLATTSSTTTATAAD
jgi:hypothetical protein